MSAATPCPVCNTRLAAFVRIRTNEYVVYCPKCSADGKKRCEGVGGSYEEALKAMGARKEPEQKALL